MTDHSNAQRHALLDAALSELSDDDRRVFARLQPKPNVSSVEVRIIHRGSVVDESSGGIGLIVTSDQGLQVGQPVEVGYGGFPIRAEVRYIEATAGGCFRVGLRWVDPFIIQWADPNLLERLEDEATSEVK
jgi:hypothetical protein